MKMLVNERNNMSTTEKPPAEVVGDLEEVMKRDKCTDGRSLFRLEHKTINEETFILAGTELQAWKALFPKLGKMERMTQAAVSERYRQRALELMEQRNAEAKTNGETAETEV